MALTRLTMTDEQRKSVALEYLKAYDNGGVTSTGGSILDLFADDVYWNHPQATRTSCRFAYPLAGGNTSGPAKPDPRCSRYPNRHL